MKKSTIKYFVLFSAALFVQACAKPSYTEFYNPDTTLYRTGKVTLCLDIESVSIKAEMDNDGHFLFKKGDEISAVCTDGTIFTMAMTGTGDTRHAFFEGTVPSGKTLGDIVVYPAGILETYSDGILELDLPGEYEYGTSSYVCPMVGRLGEDFNVILNQLTACLTIDITGLPSKTGYVRFTGGEGKQLSGDYQYALSGIGETGIELKEGESGVTFTMPVVDTESSFTFPVPVGSMSSIYMTVADKNGESMGTQEIKGFSNFFIRASTKSVEAESHIVIKGTYLTVIGGESVELKEVEDGIWAADIDVPSSGTMVLNIDSVPYGFKFYSGAGGIGYCRNVRSALPFYNFTASHDNFYYVEKSLGEMSLVGDEGESFWFDLPYPGKIHFELDSTRVAGPSYYMELEKNDSKIIFEENFDLFVGGGDGNFYLAGSYMPESITEYDGIGAMNFNSALWNYPARGTEMIDYPVKVASTVPNETYISNRGMEGWTLVRAGERPCCIQLNHGNKYQSSATTPALADVNGTEDAVITLEISRFSATSLSDITVELIGGGTFESGSVSFPTYSIKGGKVEGKSTTYSSLSGSEFVIGTDYCPAPSYNNAIDKPVSTYIFNVKGLTPDTRIKIDAPFVNTAPPRCFIYGIKVERK